MNQTTTSIKKYRRDN